LIAATLRNIMASSINQGLAESDDNEDDDDTVIDHAATIGATARQT
jgi:hypothetical protein